MTGPLVGAVVVGIGPIEQTWRAVTALRRSTVVDQSLRVVAPPEPGRQLAAELSDGPRVLKAPADADFATAANLGIVAALADAARFVWIVGATTPVATDTLERLLEVFEEFPDAGAATAAAAPAREVERDLGEQPWDSATFPSDIVLVRSPVLRRVGSLPSTANSSATLAAFGAAVRDAGWRTMAAPHALPHDIQTTTRTAVR